MPEGDDLFLSYAHADAERAEPLIRALRDDLGVSVWRDTKEIEDFESISRAIVSGLAASKAILCVYSATYLTRRACQWELTAALVALQGGEARRARILVVNPERDPADPAGQRMLVDHIRPVALRDSLLRAVPQEGDETGTRELAQAIATHLASVEGTFGDLRPLARPDWHPTQRTGSPRFVGRVAQLLEINDLLHGSDYAASIGEGGPGVAIVRGLAGTGKTLLAEEYALRFGAAYPGGILWLTGAAPDLGPEALADQLLSQLQGLGAHLGLAVADLSLAEVSGLIGRHLERRGETCLWVVDDLPEGLSAEALRAWLSPSGLAKTIVTTRGRYELGARPVEPGELEPAEALALLSARRAPAGEQEREAARGIASDLGHHALALDVVGAALALDGARSFQSFRAELARADRDRLAFAAELVAGLPYEKSTNVAAVLAASIARLEAEGLDLLLLASLLAPIPIPADLVAEVLAAVADLAPGEAADRRALAYAQVDRLALAERAGAGDRVVHALTSRTLRFLDPAPARAEAIRRAAVEVLRARLGPDLVGGFAEREAYATHALALAAAPADTDTAWLLGRVGLFDRARGAYARAGEVLARQVAALERIAGPEHPNTLAATGNLAATLHAQGDLAGARALGDEVLAARRRLLGDEHPDTLMATNNLADTLAAQGDLAGARALHEQALAVYRRTLGDEHPGTLAAMNDLAATLHAQGDLAGARALQDEVLAARRRLLGDEHPDTLTATGNLALTLEAQGDLAGARALQDEVLAARRRLLGDEHPDTLAATGNLANTLHAQGDLAGARALQDEVLAARRRLLGDEHPDTLAATGNLANTLHRQGDLAGARALGDEALAARRRLLGDEHPDTLAAMSNLATTLAAQGDLAGARALGDEALAGRRRLLGDEHPATLTSMNNLAATLKAQGDPAGARALWDEVLAGRRRLLGDEHPDTLAAMADLATTLAAQGDLPGARALMGTALSGFALTLGPDHPYSRKAAQLLSIIEAELNRSPGRLRRLRGRGRP